MDKLSQSGEVRRRRLNHLLFPGPAKEFDAAIDKYGDISVVDTFHYLYGINSDSEEEVTIDLEPGVRMITSLEALGEPDDHGERTAMFNYNGSIRPVQVRDQSASVDVVAREKADANVDGSIGSPFSGAVTASVEVGAEVSAGETVAVIEAMKMESSITTPVAGKVVRVTLNGTENLGGGDLVVLVE
jgi:pyruvate carboxylase